MYIVRVQLEQHALKPISLRYHRDSLSVSLDIQARKIYADPTFQRAYESDFR